MSEPHPLSLVCYTPNKMGFDEASHVFSRIDSGVPSCLIWVERNHCGCIARIAGNEDRIML